MVALLGERPIVKSRQSYNFATTRQRVASPSYPLCALLMTFFLRYGKSVNQWPGQTKVFLSSTMGQSSDFEYSCSLIEDLLNL